MRPLTLGYHDNANAERDGGLGYDASQSAFRMTWVPGTLLAYKLDFDFPSSTTVISLGGVVDIDPGDLARGAFKLALYDSDPVGGLPRQLIAETRNLSGNDAEGCLAGPPELAGGRYWLLLRVPSDENAVHLEASNVDKAGAVPGIPYMDMQVETNWPSGVDWNARLQVFPPPLSSDPGLVTVPHLFVRYLPPYVAAD